MKATATIAKWGNSEGVRIPREIRQATGLGDGTVVSIETRDGGVFLKAQGREVGTRRIGRYELPDLDALFAGYQGSQPEEEGLAGPVGGEHL